MPVAKRREIVVKFRLKTRVDEKCVRIFEKNSLLLKVDCFRIKGKNLETATDSPPLHKDVYDWNASSDGRSMVMHGQGRGRVRRRNLRRKLEPTRVVDLVVVVTSMTNQLFYLVLWRRK